MSNALNSPCMHTDTVYDSTPRDPKPHNFYSYFSRIQAQLTYRYPYDIEDQLNDTPNKQASTFPFAKHLVKRSKTNNFESIVAYRKQKCIA